MKARTSIAPRLKSALHSAFVQQGLIMVPAGMILDGGEIAQCCFYAFAAFWVGVGVMLWRRRSAPTNVDVVIVRGGFIVLCVLSFFLTHEIWHLRGY